MDKHVKPVPCGFSMAVQRQKDFLKCGIIQFTTDMTADNDNNQIINKIPVTALVKGLDRVKTVFVCVAHS